MESQAKETTTVPGAPNIPGLTFRHFSGDEDYPAMLEVNNNSKIADDLAHDLHTIDTLRHVYSTTHNHDPHKDTLIAEVAGKMVAFNRVFWERELSGPRIYYHFGFVRPEWRNKGLGAAMIHWAEDHARAIDASLGEESTSLLCTEVHSTMIGLENLLKSDGYSPVRFSYHMETPDLDHIPDMPMPAGLEVRPALPEHYHTIWQASAEAFQDEWGASEFSDTDYEDWISDARNEPQLWMVAWDNDQVAGSILNFINHAYNERTGRKIGYTESISVRRPWRKRGLAGALLSRSMNMFKDMGMTQTALGVDTENPSGALRVYEKMGYKPISHSTNYRKPLR